MVTLLKNEYIKSILLVMTGTASVQVVFFITLPIITSIFPPEVYGVYSERISYALIFSLIICFGLDRAIPLSRRRDLISNTIFLLSTVVSLLIILGVFFILIFDDSKYVIILLLSALISICSILNYYLVSLKKFKKEATSRFYQTLLLSLGQLSLGFLSNNSYSLIIADFFSRLFLIIYTIPKNIKLKIRTSARFFFENRSFYTYGLLSSVLTSVAMNAPVLLIAYYYDTKSVGLFYIAQKLTTAPISLLGSSIGKVYFVTLTEHKNDIMYCKGFFLSNIKKTISLAMLIPLAIYVMAQISPYFFSENWSDIPTLIMALTPLAFGQMIFNPISMTNTTYGKQIYDFIFSLLRVSCLVLVYYISNELGFQLYKTVLIYSFIMMVLYSSMVYFSYKNIENKS